MSKLISHDDPEDAAAYRSALRIVRQCDESESAMARTVWQQAEARDPAPEPNEWILPAIIAVILIAIVIVGTLAWMGY